MLKNYIQQGIFKGNEGRKARYNFLISEVKWDILLRNRRNYLGKLNLAVNQLLERKDVFADLMNGTLFDGEQILHQEEMERISDHFGVFQPGMKRRLNARERDEDVRMKASVGTYSVIFANETQGAVHYAMPVRNMLYDALEYTKQVQEIEKQHKDAGEKLDGDEFLSGIKKEDRIRPVITTVLYCGDDGSTCFAGRTEAGRRTACCRRKGGDYNYV